MKEKEFENLFHILGKIKPPNYVKDKILNNILEKENKMKIKNKKKIFFPVFAAIASILIFVVLINTLNLGSNNANINNDETEDTNLFSTISVSKSVVAMNNDENSFKALLPLRMNSVQIEDVTWNKSLESTLKGLVKTEISPSSKPLYDLNVYSENQEEIKFKVWDDSNGIILKDMENGVFYKSSSSDAASVLLMMNNIFQNK